MMEVQKWQPHLHCCAMEMPVAPTPTIQVPCNLSLLLFGKLFLLLPTNPPELPSPGYPWSWIHKSLQEIDSGTVTKSQSVHCVIEITCIPFCTHIVLQKHNENYENYIWLCCAKTLHPILHTHLCYHNQNMKTTSGYVAHRLCTPLCTYICVRKAQPEYQNYILVLLCTDFAFHSAHTFVFRKHNQNIKKPYLIYAVDRECSELLYLEDLEVQVTVRPPA